MKILSCIEEIELKYSFPRINQEHKFNLISDNYSEQIRQIIPYILYFTNQSQPEREAFFSKVPVEAIADARALLSEYHEDIDSWLDNEKNKMSDNYIALSMFGMNIDEYYIGRAPNTLSDETIEANINDMLNEINIFLNSNNSPGSPSDATSPTSN